jgi:N-methylhydantoinase A
VLRHRELAGARPEPSRRAVAAQRQAYFPGLGLVATPVRNLESLAVGERLSGPLLIESPVTTVVLDEHSAAERAPTGSLLIDSVAVDAAVSVSPPEAARTRG